MGWGGTWKKSNWHWYFLVGLPILSRIENLDVDQVNMGAFLVFVILVQSCGMVTLKGTFTPVTTFP